MWAAKSGRIEQNCYGFCANWGLTRLRFNARISHETQPCQRKDKILDEETVFYSSADVARILGLAPAYIRTMLRRHPHLEPIKVGTMRIWAQEDVDRIREWHSAHKRAARTGERAEKE